MEIVKFSHWWWGWAPDDIEDWLETMAKKGFVAVQGNWLGVAFWFRESVPQKIRYCSDFRPGADAQYRLLFEDDGWQLVWSGKGWFIWGKPWQDGQRPEIYTDYQSLISRNKRIMLLMIICLVILTVTTVFEVVMAVKTDGSLLGMVIILMAELLFFGSGFLKLRKITKRLGERSR